MSRSRSLLTTFEPMSPVPPITTIFMTGPPGVVGDGALEVRSRTRAAALGVGVGDALEHRLCLFECAELGEDDLAVDRDHTMNGPCVVVDGDDVAVDPRLFD